MIDTIKALRGEFPAAFLGESSEGPIVCDAIEGRRARGNVMEREVGTGQTSVVGVNGVGIGDGAGASTPSSQSFSTVVAPRCV